MSIHLDDHLRSDYLQTFKSLACLADKRDEAVSIASRIIKNQEPYTRVSKTYLSKYGKPTPPWWVIGCLHNMECSLDFTKHLHNGDSLLKRTHNEPSGRPLGKPPFRFIDSAIDALILKKIHSTRDDLSSWLYYMEAYNGFGYRLYHPETPSPYLYGGSNHQKSGKYVSDGKWDLHSVTEQIGVATLTHVLMFKGSITVTIA